MERLPYIDDLAVGIVASREQTWAALRSVLRAELGGGAAAPLFRVLGVVPASAAGEWSGDLRGVAVPGFAVVAAVPNERLELNGRHRFARYALTFELESEGPDRTRLNARTNAEFPGLRGRLYRALVIGSGAHRVVGLRLLRRVARRAAS
jgi:hypothetical protein